MRILFLNDIVDHDNWGGDACSWTLRRLLTRAIPGVEIESLSYKWTIRRLRQAPRWLGYNIYEGSRGVLDRFSRSFNDSIPFVADQFEEVAREWSRGHGGPTADDFLSAIHGCDAVVFNAEGSTYRNNLSAVRSLFALWYARTELGLPSFFFNGSVTLTPVDPLLPAIAGRTFRILDGIAVREPYSARNIADWLEDCTPEVVPDSVFSLVRQELGSSQPEYRKLATSLQPRRYFCASLSMLMSTGSGYLRWGAESCGFKLMLDELHQLCPQLVLIYKDRQDERIIQSLAAATGAFVFGPNHNYWDLIRLLQNAAFLVSGRYHHLIFSAIAGCPAIPLKTTSHKVDGLCELVDGHFGTAIDPTDLKAKIGIIRERAKDLVVAGEESRTELRQCAERLCARTVRYEEIIREVLTR